jgi:L-amino acid N-acyltransferase YncA
LDLQTNGGNQSLGVEVEQQGDRLRSSPDIRDVHEGGLIWPARMMLRSPSRALVASQLQIRPFEPADWRAVWALLEPVFRAGETFPHDPAISETEARVAWVEQSQAVMVAVNAAGAVVGTYYLRPNSLALGAHVANAGYVVAEHCRRQGIGSRLCQHSLQAARGLGFRAMQFNLVVSTNTAGIRCWQRNGFEVVGTLPGAFRHRQLGFVDALVMVQGLVEGPAP